MKPASILFFLSLLLTQLWVQARAQTIELTDDRGSTIRLDKPASRIISLAPHITENLFRIGAGDRIVGVTSYSDYPEAARSIELVGTYKSFDIEKIIALEPDLIIGWVSGNPAQQIELIERFELPVFLTEPRTFEGVANELRRFGQLTGTSQAAERQAQLFSDRIDLLIDTYSRRPAVQVFYQVWNNPMITLNGEHLMSRLIEGCGGVNIYADMPALAPRVSEESVLSRNPEVVIASGMGHEKPAWLDQWKRFDFLHAVRNNHLYHVHPDLIERHTTRLADGMKEICAIIERVRISS